VQKCRHPHLLRTTLFRFIPALFHIGQEALAADADPAVQRRHLAEVGDVAEAAVVLQDGEGI
jgi:hypothetical protein